MKTKATRRDILRFVGGSAAGLLLTPAPWKLTDDLAIWTQNWSWIPRPPRGKVTSALAVCSLCDAACRLRARCVGGAPVSLTSAGRERDRGGPCPLGLTGHHLAYHPYRATRPSRLLGAGGGRRVLPVQLEAVLAAMRGAARRGRVAVLDQRPGRAVSLAWRRLLAGLPGGVYVPTPNRPDAALTTLRHMLAPSAAGVAIDVAAAAGVLEIGHGPSRRGGVGATSAAGRPVRQVAARPGSEGALALAMANVMLAERLVDAGAARLSAPDFDAFAELVASFTPSAVAALTGLTPDLVAATARGLAGERLLAVPGFDPASGPLGREAETAIWALDLLLGHGTSGALVERPAEGHDADAPLADETELEDVPDGSLSLLLLDASAGDPPFPWGLVERKLVSGGGVVACLSPFLAGSVGHADYVVPVPVFLDAWEEAPARPFEPGAQLALSAPLTKPPDGVVDPVAFARAAAAALGCAPGFGWTSAEEAIRARAAAVYRSGRGAVAGACGETSKPVSGFPSAEAFWAALRAGGRWHDGAAKPLEIGRFAFLGRVGDGLERLLAATARDANARPLTLVPIGCPDAAGTAAVSPLLGKLYRESSLRRGPGEAAVHPETGTRCGLRAGRRARLSTASGSLRVVVAFDPAVPPGVVEVAVAPSGRALGDGDAGWEAVVDLCDPGRGTSWRATSARLGEA